LCWGRGEKKKKDMSLSRVAVLGGVVTLGLACLGKFLQLSMENVRLSTRYLDNFRAISQNDWLRHTVEELHALLTIESNPAGLAQLDPICECLDLLARFDAYTLAATASDVCPYTFYLVADALDKQLMQLVMLDFCLPQLGADVCRVVEQLTAYRDRLAKNIYLATVSR
jgi:hypothetical protein